MTVRVVRVASSLPLQKLLYYNFYYACCFGVVELALTIFKLRWLVSSTETTYTLAVLVPAWCVLEALRLRLGYVGNLMEKVRCWFGDVV